ncbi:MAG: hypothetical protein K0Q51_379 [Rickettsiaceae bacterium]|jgi:hypothetical protein|nr:hypothetical protein [Rickettsiaceae bacterium]
MLDYIYKFKEMLYELIMQNEYLKTHTNGVFLNIQQDAKYPYILISDFKAKSISLHERNQYDAEFNITVFTRTPNPIELMKIGENIAKIVTRESFKSEYFNILNIKAGGFEISPGHDLITTKLVISYKMIIR